MKKTLSLLLLFLCSVQVFSQDAAAIQDEDTIQFSNTISEKTDTLSSRPAKGNSETVTIGTQERSIDPAVQFQLNDAWYNAKRGTAQFIFGLCLDVCVGTPLVIAGAVTGKAGLVLGGAAVGLVSPAFVISGPIRCGVGGSMAYDAGRSAGLTLNPPKHWTIYKAGWVIQIIGIGLNFISTMIASTGGESAPGLSYAITGLSVASDVLWLSSCISSIRYVKSVREREGLSAFGVQPLLGIDKTSGLLLTYRF